ncbi:hypothetical protein EV715DRAFT_268134 [Schizophyllum commune]
MSFQPPTADVQAPSSDLRVPAKRQRTDTEGADTLSTPTRCQQFWFEDGSVVLCVGSTPGAMLFRVHKTILANNSEIFKDMFSIPQPPGQEHIDDCPVIRLPDDPTRIWMELLAALYDILFFDKTMSLLGPACISRLGNVATLSTKYRFVSLRRKCISSLSSFGCVTSTLTTRARPLPFIDATLLLQAARNANIPTLLPFAFLSVAYQDNGQQNMILDCPNLPVAEKAIALNGLQNLLELQRTLMFPFVDNFKNAKSCDADCELDVAECFPMLFLRPHALRFHHGLDGRPLFEEAKGALCAHCYKDVCNMYYAGRQKVWEMLPSIFRVGNNWDELLRVQNYDAETPL